MMRAMLVPGLMILAGVSLALFGIGGFLALVMIAGGPNGPPPEQSGQHALVWYFCVLVGTAVAIVGIIRTVVVVRRHLRSRS
jgi:uncharacterized membrane protein YfcA